MKDFYNLGAAYLEKCKLEHPSPELCRALKRHVFGDLWDKWNTDRKWRERRAADAGIELPSIELLSPPTGTSSRIAYHSLVTPLEQEPPPCISRGSEAIHHEPCNCGSAAKIPVFPCSIHKRCVLTGSALAKIKDADARNSLRSCTDCPDRNVPVWDITDITACIVTSGQHDTIKRLIKSIGKFYPELKILTQESMETEDISIAKNKLLEKCDTDLLLLLEDSFVFTERTTLEDFISILNSNPELNIVCGAELHINQSRYLNTSSEFKTINGNRVRHHNSSPWRFLNGIKYQLCDAGHNFLLVKKYKAIKWSENGHDEWFSMMSGCSFTPDVTINNFRDA